MQVDDGSQSTTTMNIVQSSGEAKPPESGQEASEWKWEDDSSNPYNWPKWKKNLQLAMISMVGFSCSIGTSIVSPARSKFVEEFGVSSTAAFLPLSLYVLALGLGPVLGGPLSETAGRQAVHIIAVVFGGLFALGSGLTNSFSGLCMMRFLSGFFYGPVLAIGSGVLNETYLPVERGLPSTIFILSPFLGPGLGPVLGSFLVDRKGWRWTQYTLVFFSVFSLIWLFLSGESYHPVLLRRRRKQLGLVEPRSTANLQKLRQFLTVGLLRPLHMLFTEPIVAILSLYVACMFGTLFMFFGAFFYVFDKIHGYTLTQTGLVFLAIAFGCVLGCITMVLCDHHIYQPKARQFSPSEIPPELRLYPAMLGSLGLPISLFWFGWTARPDVNAAVPIIAIVIFGWGNITLTISSIQYLGDTYHRSNVASAASANSLARYTFAAAFPFFSLQMYQKLGIGWATSLLGFVSLALLPGPWIFFKFGKRIRQRSQYETASY
ncbi:major facilitator superfamily transporter [Colletotrichum abscissum]|uniref:Major facilitator superfamily transporter n=1 Tax=Colletotrichum abscissum TaxID=1671311 RepID=A0A9P9XC11_9PEZI|nr:major facilitator superfamily transporter [Colletotrichum abscissum]